MCEFCYGYNGQHHPRCPASTEDEKFFCEECEIEIHDFYYELRHANVCEDCACEWLDKQKIWI